MTVAILERLGDRILRSVLPQTEAGACTPGFAAHDIGTYSQWNCGSGWCGEDNMVDGCGNLGCRYWGPGYDYTQWNGRCP